MVKANTTHILLPVILFQNHCKFHMGSNDAIGEYYNKLNWSESHCEENRRLLLNKYSSTYTNGTLKCPPVVAEFPPIEFCQTQCRT